LTAQEAEQLLTGQPVGPDLRGLGRLLAAAAAPVRPGELAGELAAVEGFRRAYRRPAERRHRPRIAVALGRTVAVKATAGAVVLFVGGTALAAGTGSLPEPAQQSAHDLLGVPAPRHHEPGGLNGDGRHYGGKPADQTPSPTPGYASPTARPPGVAPSADLARLCRAYLAALVDHRDPDPAALQQLAAAAGGPQKILPYCATLLHLTPPTNLPTAGTTGGNGDTAGDHVTSGQKPSKDPPARH
jgi:hypothetical protein